MNRLLWVVAGGAWFALVYVVGFWLMFPSDAVARFIDHRARQALGYAVIAEGVRPWWFGLSLEQVRVHALDDGDDIPELVVREVGARVHPFSVLGRVPRLTSYLQVGDGRLDLTASLALKDGAASLRSLRIDGDTFPADELFQLIGLGAVRATGGLDVDVDLAPAGGDGPLRGRLSLLGRGLTLDTITAEALGWEDRELGAVVDLLDLQVDVDDGKGDVKRGVLTSSLADVELDGEITLPDALGQLGRARLDLSLILKLTDWADSPLESYRSVLDGLLAPARWEDGSYHYEVDGPVGRLGPGDFRAVRERARSSVGRRSGSSDAPTPSLSRPSAERPTSIGSSALERFRERREAARRPMRADEPLDDELDDELLDDEELDDELPDEELDDELDEELEELGY